MNKSKNERSDKEMDQPLNLCRWWGCHCVLVRMTDSEDLDMSFTCENEDILG